MMKRLGCIAMVLSIALGVLPAAAAPLGGVPAVDRAQSLLAPAQAFACRACRRDCYARYRTYCGYSEYCRRSFTLCMRDCWYGYCR